MNRGTTDDAVLRAAFGARVFRPGVGDYSRPKRRMRAGDGRVSFGFRREDWRGPLFGSLGRLDGGHRENLAQFDTQQIPTLCVKLNEVFEVQGDSIREVIVGGMVLPGRTTVEKRTQGNA
jgi:hypothetical protein